MEEKYMLTAEEYYKLYRKAFARLDELATLAENAMKELEELHLQMGDRLDMEINV